MNQTTDGFECFLLSKEEACKRCRPCYVWLSGLVWVNYLRRGHPDVN
jgi:hypothetical protein